MGGVLRKLRKKAGERYAVEPLHPHIPPPSEKMSRVILQFAEPLLESTTNDDEYEAAIGLAVLCWDMAMMPEQDRQEFLDKTLRAPLGLPFSSAHELATWVQRLLDRKNTLFADNTRFVLDYTVVQGQEGPRLLVMSTPQLPDVRRDESHQ